MQGIQIVYRPEHNNQDDMGIRINERENKKREETLTKQIIKQTTTEPIFMATTQETTIGETRDETTNAPSRDDSTLENIRDKGTTEKNEGTKRRKGFEEKITIPRKPSKVKPEKPEKILFEHDVLEHTTEGYRNWDNVWKSLLKMLEDHPELVKNWI